MQLLRDLDQILQLVVCVCDEVFFWFFLQAGEERNYHVFYEMLVGLAAEEKHKYGLLSAEDYFYLNQVRRPFCLI